MSGTSSKIKHDRDSTVSMPRRAAIAAGMAGALTASLPMASASAGKFDTAGDPVRELVKLADEKNTAFMRGDMDRWANLVSFASDFTLMQPFGGTASHGFDKSPKRLAELSRYFRNGQATVEVVQSYSSFDLVVLVMIERQHGEVGGLPVQDWSLRVTEVYRKTGAEWQWVHRHADPLVRRITLAQAAGLARGQS